MDESSRWVLDQDNGQGDWKIAQGAMGGGRQSLLLDLRLGEEGKGYQGT